MKFSRVKLRLTPQETVEIPHSDGYLLYSAVLNEIQEIDETESEKLHEIDTGISVSMLDGSFKSVSPERKRVFDDAVYEVYVSFTGDYYERFIDTLIQDQVTFRIADGLFDVLDFNVVQETVDDLVNTETAESVKFNFISPTRISNGSVSEVFPQRVEVFYAIQSRWNEIVDEQYQTSLTREQLRKACYEEYTSLEVDRYNIRVANTDGVPSTKPAFVGQCTYSKTPDESISSTVWDDIRTLAKASEYIGVGSDISRGLGTVNIEFQQK